MGIFVNKDEEIKVEIFVGKNADGISIASSKKEEVAVVEENVIAVFRLPSYKDNTELFSNATTTIDGNFTIDFPTLRYLRVVQLIKSWNLSVSASVDNINSLRPEVGEALQLGLESFLK